MTDTPHVTTLVRDFDPGVVAQVYARNAVEGSFAFAMPGAAALDELRGLDSARVILAEYSKTIIGAAILTFPALPGETRVVPWFSREDLAVLSRIVVEHDMRGMGVASQLIACAERTARRMGAADLGCALNAASGDFLGPLERRGFKPAAKFTAGDDKIVALRKPLESSGALAA
ncbi:MAG: GNAT family N-acetyltransferase [Phycisphaerales bacterium]